MEASKLLSAASNMPNSQAYGLLRCAAGKLIGGIEIRQKKGMERLGHAWVLGLIWFLFWIPEPIISYEMLPARVIGWVNAGKTRLHPRVVCGFLIGCLISCAQKK